MFLYLIFTATWLQEEQYAQEFLKYGGLGELADIIYTATGNTLAVSSRPIFIIIVKRIFIPCGL